MLRWNLNTTNFSRFSQSGMYIDFILKQIGEYFIRNILIYTSLFFGEKYVIEYLTKKTIDSFVFSSNSLFDVSSLSFTNLLILSSSFIVYSIAFLALILIIV